MLLRSLFGLAVLENMPRNIIVRFDEILFLFDLVSVRFGLMRFKINLCDRSIEPDYSSQYNGYKQ